MKALLLVNPWATGVAEEQLKAVRAVLPRGTELRMTSAGGEATEIAREVSGRVDALYVFGGDGTHEVLNGIDAARRSVSSREEERVSCPVRWVCQMTPSRLLVDWRPGRRAGSASAVSTGVDSGSRAGSASTPRSCARSTSSDGVRTGDDRATSGSHGRHFEPSAGIALARARARGGRSRTGGVRARLEQAGSTAMPVGWPCVPRPPHASRAASTWLRPWPAQLPGAGLQLAWYALGRGKRATARHVPARTATRTGSR